MAMRDLKQLEGHVRIGGCSKKAMWQGIVDVGEEAIPYQMDVRNIPSKGRSLARWKRPARKRLLEKKHTRTVLQNVSLELGKLTGTSDAADVPGDDMELEGISEQDFEM